MRAGRVAAALTGVTFVAAVSLVAYLMFAETAPDAPLEPAADDPPAGITPPPPRSVSAVRPAERHPRLDTAPLPRLSGEFHVTGQVIDDEEKPVAGATVKALRGGVAADETKSDAGGRFVLRCGKRPEAGSVDIGISATYGPVRAAWESYELMEDSRDGDDVGQIQLEPAVPIVARVEDVDGPVKDARVFVGSFFGAVFAEATTDEYGVARFDTTPETDAWLFAFAPGRGRARGEIPDGRDPKVPLVLTLSARSVRVSVVEMPGGNPMSGERVTVRLVTPADGRTLYSSVVPPLDLPATGDTGTIVIDDLGAEETLDLARADPNVRLSPWRSAGPGSTHALVGPREIEGRIDVRTGRTLRWRIVPGDAPVPAEGAVVRLTRGTRGALPSGPVALHVEDGSLVGYGFGEGTLRGVAVADDGSMAALTTGSDARFMRPRTITVTVRDTAGRPVPETPVVLQVYGGDRSGDSVSTDTEGVARFSGIEAELGILDVYVRLVAPSEARWVAAVDPARGDANIGVVLPARQAVVLRVTTNGERKLPPQWRVLVNATFETNTVVQDAADIVVPARTPSGGGPIRVSFRADGFTDVDLDLTPSADDSPIVVPVVLDAGATLWAEYRPSPVSQQQGGSAVMLERWSPETLAWETWRDRPALGMQRRPGPDGRYRFDAMPAGRYRLSSNSGAVTSEPVDVVSGATPAVLRLDLSRGGVTVVRVLGPDGKPAVGWWVAIDVPGRAPPRMEGSASHDAMNVVVPGDRAVRLLAQHGLLRPDPEKGHADVTAGGGEVVLQLVEGAVITLVPRLARPMPQSSAPMVGLQLFEGAAEGPPLWIGSPRIENDRIRIGGIAPGRYTLWIRLPGAAPVVLQGVDLAQGDNDLGEIRPPRGSSIRFKMDVPEGQAAQRVTMQARRISDPVYVVSANSSGEAVAELPGLGPGRFVVTIRSALNNANVLLQRTVDVDGASDVVIDSSLR